MIVLGAGAGGGLPQWNCGCKNCEDARAGTIAPMTQSSVAVSADGQSWLLLNASPDIRAQLAATPALFPRRTRDTPISAVMLTNADIDHIAGLLTLREKTAFRLLASADVLTTLAENAVFNVMDSALVQREAIALDHPVEALPGLSVTPFAVPGKVALYLEKGHVKTEEIGEQTVGLMMTDGKRRVAYVPGCAALPDWLIAALGSTDLILFDGTVWENDDMARTGTGEKTGARMGHIAMKGQGGILERLAELSARKIFIHLNNTNPVLQPEGPERARLRDAGWEVAFDGMEITL